MVTLFVFIMTYYFMLSEKYKTAVMAMLTALILSATGIIKDLTIENLPQFIDFNTLGLLTGMMIIVGLLKHTGFFHLVAVYAVRMGKGNLKRTISLIILSVAMLSAILDNVTTLLVFAPILFSISDATGLDPAELITTAILASNIGGVSTLIGDPPNVLIGSASDLSFMNFIWHLSPAAIVVLVFMVKKTNIQVEQTEELSRSLRAFAATDLRSTVTDFRKLKYLLFVFVLVIIGFSLHSVLGIEMSLIAMLGAVVSMVISGKDFEEVSKEIEWNTIFFLIGLFILTYSLKEAGLTDAIAAVLLKLPHPLLIMLLLVWLGGFGAMFLGAVPATTIFIPIVKSMIGSGLPTTAWWALALGVGLGANGSAIGAAANMVGLGLLRKFSGRTIGFREFFKKNIPFVLIILTFCTAYISLMFLIGW